MWGPQRPKFGGFWILDFGDFGDFGFWILGILDFGDFGVWGFWCLGILDFGFCDKFWMLHKKRRLCTPNRVGGFSWIATVFGLLTPSAIWLYLDFISFPDHFLLLILTFFKKHSKHSHFCSLHFLDHFFSKMIFRWREENPADLAGSLPALARSSPPGAPCGREHTRARRSAEVAEKSWRFLFLFWKSERGTKPCHGEVSNFPLQTSNCQKVVLDVQHPKSKREFGAERHPRLRHLA